MCELAFISHYNNVDMCNVADEIKTHNPFLRELCVVLGVIPVCLYLQVEQETLGVLLAQEEWR